MWPTILLIISYHGNEFNILFFIHTILTSVPFRKVIHRRKLQHLLLILSHASLYVVLLKASLLHSLWLKGKSIVGYHKAKQSSLFCAPTMCTTLSTHQDAATHLPSLKVYFFTTQLKALGRDWQHWCHSYFQKLRTRFAVSCLIAIDIIWVDHQHDVQYVIIVMLMSLILMVPVMM